MPIPKPKQNESRQRYINRCMGDDTMTSEYTDSDQRLAVCTTEYDSNKEDSIQNDEKHIREVRETEDSYIIEFGKSEEESGHHDDEEGSKETTDVLEIKSELKAYHDQEENK